MSIRTKLHLSITALVLLVSVGANYALCRHAQQSLFQEVRQRLASLAQSVAIQIDASAHNSLSTRKDESTPAYKQIKSVLRKFRDANPDIRYIYTMRPGKRHMVWQFVVDAEEDPELVSHVGDDYKVGDFPELRAGLSRPSADTEITHDKWGNWVSGYAPIRDKAGRAVGIVGADMSVHQLAEEMSLLRSVGITCTGLAALFSIILGAVLSKLFLSPIGPFIKRLNTAARGDLDTLVDDRRKDEIGEVAKTFNNMLSALKYKDKMLSEMNTDYLTGLNNHRYFQERLREEIHIAQGNSGEFALLMLDLDRFKLVNDSFGHMVGDSVLRQVSKALISSTFGKEFIARYGGEEFTIILPNTPASEAVAMAERLRKVIAASDFEASPPFRADDAKAGAQPIRVTVSVGVAIYPRHSREQDGLIMAADIALYQAKHLGRDRVCAYDTTLEEGQADPYQVYAFIQDPTKSAIEALAAAVDARDHYTRNHSENVSKYALMIAERLGLNKSEVELLHKASLLHDVGKIGVPDNVLNKPTTLTQDEMELVRMHPAVGEAIVRDSRNLDATLPAILYHHEYYNGKGYPYGLIGDQIPLLARIISVADAFDALTTDRPYRRAHSIAEALEVLRECSGTQFDPKIVEAFIKGLESSGYGIQDLAA